METIFDAALDWPISRFDRLSYPFRLLSCCSSTAIMLHHLAENSFTNISWIHVLFHILHKHIWDEAIGSQTF